LIAVWWERFHQGTRGALFALGPLERLIVASHAVWFYLGKLFWPTNLTFIYPRWTIMPGSSLSYGWLAAGTAFCAMIYFARRHVGRSVEVAAVFFVATLSPVLGFIMLYTFRYTFVADHYQYLACIGPIALASAGVVQFSESLKLGPRSVWAIGILICGVLGTLTWRQSASYADIETLWRTTIARNPSCWMAESNLAGHLLERGEVDEAIVHFKKAVEIWPGHAEAHNNLGSALVRKGATREAMVHFQKVLEIWPNDIEARNNLGGALLQEGRIDEAIPEFERIIEEKPDDAKAHNNLGNALLQKGQIDGAIANYEKTLELPFDHAGSHYNLGNAFLQKGEIDEAIAHYRQALELRPNHANTHNNLGNALRQKGLIADAIAQFQQAAEIEPGSILFQNNLAWVLAICPDPSLRNGQRAVQLAEHANQLSGGGNPVILHTLAAAYAETTQFSRALGTAQRALELADAQGNTSLANSLRQEIALYQKGLAYHEGPK
jgi:tetratricopeptide (TPR) repeat protein